MCRPSFHNSPTFYKLHPCLFSAKKTRKHFFPRNKIVQKNEIKSYSTFLMFRAKKDTQQKAYLRINFRFIWIKPKSLLSCENVEQMKTVGFFSWLFFDLIEDIISSDSTQLRSGGEDFVERWQTGRLAIIGSFLPECTVRCRLSLMIENCSVARTRLLK